MSPMVDESRNDSLFLAEAVSVSHAPIAVSAQKTYAVPRQAVKRSSREEESR